MQTDHALLLKEGGLQFVRDSGLNFIEQLQKIAQTPCESDRLPFLTGVSEIDCVAILTKPSCKMWKCKSCAARNAKRWIARIINHCNKSDTANGWFMFTLTAHENWRGREASTKNLRQGWKKLYNRMRYEFGVSQYARVWESHADGTMHLHGLIDSVMDERWLKDNARECGMGYQVDLHFVENAGQVAGYISKYFLKSEVIGDYPKNLRRIEVSRNWLPLPDLTSGNVYAWLRNETRDGQLITANRLSMQGYRILDFVKIDKP